jgi:hypothetical protein
VKYRERYLCQSFYDPDSLRCHERSVSIDESLRGLEQKQNGEALPIVLCCGQMFDFKLAEYKSIQNGIKSMIRESETH